VNIRRSRRNFKARARTPVLPPARLRYLARQVHALGERPLYELLRELQQGAPLEERLEVYARLGGDFIRELDGDRLPIARVVTPSRKGKGGFLDR
jgi:hypothetical protein